MTYEYECPVCDLKLEVEQSIKDEPLKTCPRCLIAALKRLVGTGNFVLKGEGWSRDGYSKGEK